MSTLLRLAAIAIFAVAATQANAINCKSASGNTEEIICKDRELILLDDSLNQLYRSVIVKSANSATVKLNQRHWISEIRAACADSTCLSRTYKSRLMSLQKEMGPWCQSQREKLAGYWSRVGDDGFFEEFSMGPDGDFDSWLHQRPEVSGGMWKLVDCNFIVTDSSGLGVEWIITDVTKSELRAIEVSTGSARYRRTGK